MAEFGGARASVGISATGTILNPWYEILSPPRVGSIESIETSNQQIEISTAARVELRKPDLRLYFQNNLVVFAFHSNSLAANHSITPLQYFLTYKTFINYNVIGPAVEPQDDHRFPAVEHLQFKVQRIIQVETERRDGDKVTKWFHHEGVDEFIEISVESIREYLRILNPTLYYALAYYLIGCENPRYFLVEFYKAIEVILLSFQ